MSKKIMLILLCLGLVMVICFLALLPIKPNHLAISNIPSTSLEESICKKIHENNGVCKRILLYDANSHLVFVESDSGIIVALTNDDFTQFKEFIYPMLDFQEFKEEKVERGPISWQAQNNVQENFSIIYGFAEDTVKTIVINSEDNIQPNRFFLGDHLWVWYATFEQDKVKLPVEVTVYDEYGEILKGEDE